MALIIFILLLLFGVPQCAEEDGSTQPVCVWRDDTNVPVLNVGYGQHWAVLNGE